MPISVYPAPSASTTNTTFLTAAAVGPIYSAPLALVPGVYSIAGTVIGTSADVRLYNGTTLITSFTISGQTPTTVNLATPVTKIWYNLLFDGTAGAQIGVTLTGLPLVNTTVSGTLDIITSSQTYTKTATNCYVTVVGAGGGGGGSAFSTGGGGGGGSGAVLELGPVSLSGSYAVTIGAAGTAGPQTSGTFGGAGGNTQFGSLLTAGGGAGGQNGDNGGNGGAGGSLIAGTPTFSGSAGGAKGQNGGNGGNQNTTPGTYGLKFQYVRTGAVAGGGGGGSGPSLGSGIGTGGAGTGAAATGFGCGGGGRFGLNVGGAGSPGVVYVLDVSLNQ